jgi:hypothetical protein
MFDHFTKEDDIAAAGFQRDFVFLDIDVRIIEHKFLPACPERTLQAQGL